MQLKIRPKDHCHEAHIQQPYSYRQLCAIILVRNKFRLKLISKILLNVL